MEDRKAQGALKNEWDRVALSTPTLQRWGLRSSVAIKIRSFDVGLGTFTTAVFHNDFTRRSTEFGCDGLIAAMAAFRSTDDSLVAFGPWHYKQNIAFVAARSLDTQLTLNELAGVYRRFLLVGYAESRDILEIEPFVVIAATDQQQGCQRNQ